MIQEEHTMTDQRRPTLRRLIDGNLGMESLGDPPGEMELAAWLDGRLSEAQAARIETWLAGDPRLRQALIALREVQEMPLTVDERERAHALVSPYTSFAPTSDWRRWFAWLLDPIPAGAIACILAAIGFYLGSGLGATTSQREAQLLAQILGGLPLL